MTRRLVLLSLAIAALAVGLSLCWHCMPPMAPTAPAARAPAAAAATVDANAAMPEPATGPGRPPPAREAAAEIADPARLPIPDDAVWLDVHILDAATKAPVPGALVCWSTSFVRKEMAKRLRGAGPWTQDQELFTERCGWRTRADATGVARIAGNEHRALVFAYADSRCGSGTVGGTQPPHGGWRIELQADLTLRAQVLDASGRPAVGVDVGILRVGADGRCQPDIGFDPVATTAPAGLAVFRHLQWSARSGRASGRRVAPRFPGCDDGGFAFDPMSPPAAPIVLQLPPTGSLRARLWCQGRALATGVTFQLWSGPDGQRLRADASRPVRPDADGWARFAPVALGKRLHVAANAPGRIETTVDGPAAEGQEVAIELGIHGVFCLAGQALGPDAAPLAEASLMAEFDAEGSSGHALVCTDAQGRFGCVMDLRAGDRATLRRLVLTLPNEAGPCLRASVSARLLARGVNDLGTLQLTAEPLVVAGRLEAVPRVRPQFAIEALDADSDGEEHWSRVEGLTASARDDGTFEARGATRPVRHRLVLAGEDHLPIAPIEFRVGDADVVVRVDAGSNLQAKVLLPAGLPDHAVRGELVPHLRGGDGPRGAGDERYTAGSGADAEGSALLQWRALPAGSYRLDLCAGGMQQPLASIDDVVVPQPDGGDPRLCAVDLRDAVRVVEVAPTPLSLAAAAGNHGFRVFVLPQAHDRDWIGTLLPPTGRLLLPKAPVELLVGSYQYRPQRLWCSGPQLRLPVEPWPTVELTVANLPALPPGFELRVALTAARPRAGEAVRFHCQGESGLLARLLMPPAGNDLVVDGRVRLPVGDGMQRVGGCVRSQANGRSHALSSWTPAEVAGGPDAPPATVQLSPAELQQAIAALQAEPASK